MKVKLICYSLKANPTKRTLLHRELYGYKDYSNNGEYTYKRKGILTTNNAKKITDAVIIITKNHAQKLINTLQKYGAKTHVFDVISKIKL